MTLLHLSSENNTAEKLLERTQKMETKEANSVMIVDLSSHINLVTLCPYPLSFFFIFFSVCLLFHIFLPFSSVSHSSAHCFRSSSFASSLCVCLSLSLSCSHLTRSAYSCVLTRDSSCRSTGLYKYAVKIGSTVPVASAVTATTGTLDISGWVCCLMMRVACGKGSREGEVGGEKKERNRQ